MEYYVFLITMGMLLAAIFIGVGIVIGRDSKGTSCRDNNPIVCPGGDSNVCNSPMGNIHGEKRSGCDIRPDRKEISMILYTLRIGATDREKKVIDYLIDKEGAEEW